MDIAIVVATFGADVWAEEAHRIAVPSAMAAGPDELVVIHGEALHQARNDGAAQTSAEWLLFLDADDELEPGYLDAMRASSGDLRAPHVRYVHPSRPVPAPLDLSGRDMANLNPCAIGTLVRREMFYDAGQFWRERAWEDWSLFRRCWLLGATIEHVPGAVYRVNENPDGRNSTIDRPHALHRDIIRSHRRWQLERKQP